MNILVTYYSKYLAIVKHLFNAYYDGYIPIYTIGGLAVLILAIIFIVAGYNDELEEVSDPAIWGNAIIGALLTGIAAPLCVSIMLIALPIFVALPIPFAVFYFLGVGARKIKDKRYAKKNPHKVFTKDEMKVVNDL